MARKVIGPTGGRRRRWLFLCTALAAIALVVLVIPGAFAVTDEAVYQLDGNAQASDNTEQPVMPTASEDADSICAGQFALTGNGTGTNARGQFCHPASGVTLPSATSSTRFAFVTDGSGPFAASQGNTDDQYTGGSGDAQDISAWLYKNAASSNDKSDIQNAFAAEYTVGSCPTDTTHAGCHVGDKVVYFGGDRTSDSGDENTAFWFLQSPAIESPNGACTTSSGCPFTTDGRSLAQGGTLAHHVAANPGPDNCLVPQGKTTGISFTTGLACTGSSTGDSYGDILVVSAFTGGGVQPNITAYEWIGNGFAKGASTASCGTTACTTIKILSVTQGCNATDVGDTACAITNQAVQSGIVGESPQPIQAPWLYSEKVGDNGQTGANTCTTSPGKMCPSIFLEGGLNLSALGLQSECTSSFVMDTRSSQSVSSSLQDLAVGQVGSCSATLTSKAGDTTDVPENGGLAATAASPTSIGTGSVSSGTDTAALQVSGASSYTGTITWSICGPFASTPSANPKCDRTVGVPAGSASVSETDQNTHYFVSNSVTLTKVGTYCWTAHFAPGTGTNGQITAKDDTGANECFTVGAVTPTLTTCSGSYDSNGVCTPADAVNVGSAVNDSAKLSGLATEPGTNGGNSNYPSINATDGTYAGSIQFTLNGPSASGCGLQTTGGTGMNPQTTSVDAAGNHVYGPVSYTPALPGVYHWQATLSNATTVNNNLPVSENNALCTDTNEDATILQHPTTTQTTPVDGSGNTITTVLAGTTVFDHAVVTDADSGGGSPTGTVDFYICNPSAVTGTGTSAHCAGTGSVGGAGNGTGSLVQSGVGLTAGPGADQSQATVDSNHGVQVNTTGVWCFRTDYNPDTTKFVGSFDNSHDECFNVVDVSMTTAQTFTLTDSATITPSGPGATIGGGVVFTLYSTSNCATGTDVFSRSETVPDQGTAYTAHAATVYTATSSKPTLSWKVVYTPDGTATNKTVTETCNTENAAVTINNG